MAVGPEGDLRPGKIDVRITSGCIGERKFVTVITIVVGWPGAGKTYLGCLLTMEQFKGERPQVYANMAGLKCPEAIYIDALTDLAHIGNGFVLADEGGVWMSSRNYHKTPPDLLMALAQVRKNGLDMVITTQHEMRVDVIVRELTTQVIRARKLGPIFIYRYEDPIAKHVFKTRVVRYSSVVSAQYDTLEVIGLEGGGAGRGRACLSRVAQRRQAAQREQAAKTERRNGVFSWTGNVGYMKREYGEVLRSMPGDALIGRSDWCDRVRLEVARRRWLRAWSLTTDDVPETCTPSSPWLEGFDPFTVRQRTLEAADEEKPKGRARR